MVLAVYAAPIVLSGDATLAGYIKLDDTATWLAFTDQVMANGRDLDGLAPSTHEAVVAINIGDGYPVGVFIPLGIGAELLGTDPAWLIQPYMAVFALLIALAVWSLAAPFVRSPGARAAIAALAAQPALLFGYYLWGGVKELAAAGLIATAAALVAHAVGRPGEPTRLVAPAVVSGAVIGVLSGGGAVWLAPMLLVGGWALGRELPVRAMAGRAAAFALAIGFLALPVILPGGLLPPTSSPLDDDNAIGNLLEPLDPLQVAGIWPAGDFRLPPSAETLAYVLIAVALALAVLGVAEAWRRRAIGALALITAGLVGGVILLVGGSPWVDGKALATVSPVVLFATLLGATTLGATTRPWLGIVAGMLIGAGVIWSNALAYRDVSLAPREQLAELEAIGEEIAGEGPTLMTEYSPYGARHFLRDADPEGVSELRRRTIPLAGGGEVEKGHSTDTDLLNPRALGVYRTLVLRRSPAQSRPPSPYRLAWRGAFYEAWQRPAGLATVPRRLALGSRSNPVAKPRCADVKELASGARALMAAARPKPIQAPLSEPALPSIQADVQVTRPGDYEVWLGGSVRSEAELLVDGEAVAEVRHELNNLGQYVSFGDVPLEAGEHRIQFRLAGADLHPGSGGSGLPAGPIALTRAEAADSRLVRVPTADAETLCGRAWDWIEALG